MLSKKAINHFNKKGYTFEEINSINQGLKDIEEGNTIPFDDLIKQSYNVNIKEKEVCII